MHTINLQFILFFFLLSAISCNKNPDFLQQALEFAGENRQELEKVLTHYSQKPSDSLKLRAARFLIENMPRYYYFENDHVQFFKKELIEYTKRIEEFFPEINEYEGTYDIDYIEEKFESTAPLPSKVLHDCQTITAAYLIENIELSFNSWHTSPWAKQLSFDDFCELILPYRIEFEPLENWRQAYIDHFNCYADTLATLHDPADAVNLIYSHMSQHRWIFDSSLDDRLIGGNTLLAIRMGNCRSIANYVVYACRALGIPVGIDFILQNPDMMYKEHYWNFVKDHATDKNIPFELYVARPQRDTIPISRKKGKVYRKFFGLQMESLMAKHWGKPIPAPLNNLFIVDVTPEYFTGGTFSMKVDPLFSNPELLYLCVFNNMNWVPIGGSEAVNNDVLFTHIDTCIVYQIAQYDGEILTPVSFPFSTDNHGNYKFLRPEKNEFQTMYLYRKNPLPGWLDLYKHHSVGGKFEAGNKADFSDAITLHTVTHELDMDYHLIPLNNPRKFKYARYFSAYGGRCNLAELQFYSGKKEVKGKILGTEKSTRYKKSYSKYAVFDGDPLTFYDALDPYYSWVGMAFQEPVSITEIKYLFRNDDNDIREGDLYELFYFTDRGRISLGKQTGTAEKCLIYENVPGGFLYLLHNHTRGKEQRIFTYENGEAVWW